MNSMDEKIVEIVTGFFKNAYGLGAIDNEREEILPDDRLSVYAKIMAKETAQTIFDALTPEPVTVEWKSRLNEETVCHINTVFRIETTKSQRGHVWWLYYVNVLITKGLPIHNSLSSTQQAAIKFYNELQGFMLPITIGEHHE